MVQHQDFFGLCSTGLVGAQEELVLGELDKAEEPSLSLLEHAVTHGNQVAA